jgi:hypothetical protein
MSFVILNQMYFPIILSLSSDDQQFHQYQENEQSHFLISNINISKTNRVKVEELTTGWLIPSGGITPPGQVSTQL